MINKNTSKDIHKKENKVTFNLDNISSHKKSQKPESSKCSTLTDTISKNKKDSHMEKTILLTELKEKNRFKFTNRFSVLTNLRMLIFYSKEIYLLNMKNPYKIFNLKEYEYEIDNKLLLIKSKEENENKEKLATTNIYEFSDEDILHKWYNSIISSIDKMNEKSNDFSKDNYYESIKEENNEINESDNQSFNIHIDEYEETINEKEKIKLKESKIIDVSEIDRNNEKHMESGSPIKSKNKKINSGNDKKDIITKPSFRFLVKEEINKIENNENRYNFETKEKCIEEEKNCNYQLLKKGSNILSSANSNNKNNIYSFGKKADFHSFHSKSDNTQKKTKFSKEKEKIPIDVNHNNYEEDNILYNITNDEVDFSERDNEDIQIQDLSQNNITQNDLFKDKKSFINEENPSSSNILKLSQILNEDKSSLELIKLISCEKGSKSKSDINFELSDSNQKNAKIEKEKKSADKVNDFIKPESNNNIIKTSFLRNANTNSNNKEKTEIINDGNEDISCFSKINNISDNMNDSKNNEDENNNKNRIKSVIIYNDNIPCSNITKNSIFNLNENSNNKNDLDEINNIKMFDTPPQSNINNYDKSQSIINNSLFNSPKVNNFDLDNNSNKGNKILLFSNDTKNTNKSNSNENINSKKNLQNNSSCEGNSIIIIDKNNSLLNQFEHYEKIINNKIAKYSKNKQANTENPENINNDIDGKDENLISVKNINNNEIQNQESVDLIGKKKSLNKKKKNNYLIKNHFEFQYPPYQIIEYNNNNFVNIKENSKFQTQKIVNFNIENWKKDINICYFQINAESPQYFKKENFPENNKKKSTPFRNNSTDKIPRNNCYNNYINSIKIRNEGEYKNIYQKKLNKLKKNLSSECNKYPKKFRNLSIEKNSKINRFFNTSNDSIDKNDYPKIIKLDNKDSYFNKQYENKKIKNVKIYLNKNLENKRDDTCNNKHNYTAIEKPKEKVKNLKKYEKYVNVVGNVYSNKRKQGYALLEKSLDFSQNNDNVEEKMSTIKLFENLLSDNYSKKLLLYYHNEGMETTTFIPKFKEILEKNVKKNEMNLKYLFENIPKLIRNRLSKDDLQLIPKSSNCNYINYLNNLNSKKMPNNDNNNVDEFRKAKEGIKQIILNDNKYIVNILSKYFGNFSDEIIKNRLYKYKDKFILEMNKLNDEIILS